MGDEPISVDDALVEIAPEPTEAERAAILAALARELRAREEQAPGAWWAASVAERADDES